MMAETAPSNTATPSYEWRLKHGGVRPSPHILRLRWRAWEPLSAIRVLDDATDVQSPQQPYDPQTHPIAAEPVTRPPVSSMDVHLADMDLWAQDWLAEHDQHGEWDDEDALEAFGARMVAPTPSDDEWCLVEDLAAATGTDPSADDFEVPAARRVHCCGLDRPPNTPPHVTVRASTEGGVLTIGDWIAGVHALLEQQRADVLASRGQMHADCGEPVVLPDEVVYVDPTISLANVFLKGERDVGLRSMIPNPVAEPHVRISGWEGLWQSWADEARIRAAQR
ncbi:uncharacterized protein CTRU02_209490 [Colletotrichum truncatum]|uniref:Uncharacterized protein n=1 Tax=Colletotrichum truncatum TaxID=5467 RepID=A0ACC3YSM5_COLTU|nr:uncharacterized protein CTRU02_08432 [Colletotrichum truncatum]KAF6789733.1 hypothetical protein CTRU02_08432 [Colletotrichum truncatum]